MNDLSKISFCLTQDECFMVAPPACIIDYIIAGARIDILQSIIPDSPINR